MKNKKNDGNYVPDIHDLIWLNFDPQSGREIMKRRPALVLTPKRYNQISRFCVVCPISSQIKGHLFEVAVSIKNKKGVVKCDQIKSMDWQERRASFIGKAPKSVMDDVRHIIASLLFDDL